ncbi:MAG: PilW family protein, partial [Acidimicrobiia bacterium]
MRLLNRLRDERAYTLVEMITVMLIMSIVMTGISTVFVQGSNAELDMNNRFQAQSNARLALDTLRRDVHCSKWVTNPSTPQLTTAQTTITLADPCAIHTTVSTVGALSGTGTGTFSIRNTTGFPTVSATFQIDSEQVIGTLSGGTVTITTRGANDTLAVAHAVGAPVIDPDGLVSWCAVTVSGDTGLYRQLNTSGSTCGSASPAVRQMDRLTTTGVFWNQPSWAGGGFAQVYTKLPINTASAKHLGSSTDG